MAEDVLKLLHLDMPGYTHILVWGFSKGCAPCPVCFMDNVEKQVRDRLKPENVSEKLVGSEMQIELGRVEWLSVCASGDSLTPPAENRWLWIATADADPRRKGTGDNPWKDAG